MIKKTVPMIFLTLAMAGGFFGFGRLHTPPAV